MITLSAGQIAKVIDAEIFGDDNTLCSGSVETDSRLCKAGSLFVAKPGEITDGHLYIPNAMANGAVIAIVERKVDEPIVQLLVKDVVVALGQLAKFVVQEVRSLGHLKVVGVTGSNGKTTTKNMLRQILSNFGETVAPEESFNNEVGAPYSMLRIDNQTKFLVVEYGAGGLGSINYLVKLCKPDIAVELKVGMAHAGEFGGIDSTEKIKAELITDLDASDVALLNFDDNRVKAMAAKTKAKVVSFGVSEDSDYRASDIALSIAGTRFSFQKQNLAAMPVQLQILGDHHVYNALASLAVADILGLDLAVAVAALEKMKLAERWRMQVGHRVDGAVIINDAYNASPDSMKAALMTLAELGRQTGRRTIAVLGEMAELGVYSNDEHDAIGRLVVRLNIDQLVVVGAGAKLIHMGASLEGSWDGESKYFDEISKIGRAHV